MAKNPTLFGKRLKNARTKMGLTQVKLGLATGINIETAQVRINQYENSTHMPIFSVAVKIAKALNVPPSYFYEPDEKIAQHILCLGKLTTQNRKNIFDQTKKLAKI